jgi:hypothetical protein
MRLYVWDQAAQCYAVITVHYVMVYLYVYFLNNTFTS